MMQDRKEIAILLNNAIRYYDNKVPKPFKTGRDRREHLARLIDEYQSKDKNLIEIFKFYQLHRRDVSSITSLPPRLIRFLEDALCKIFNINPEFTAITWLDELVKGETIRDTKRFELKKQITDYLSDHKDKELKEIPRYQ